MTDSDGISDTAATGPAARVVIAPDSFKGSVAATDVARLIAEGWRSIRPADFLILLPQADGGEGTLDALAAGASAAASSTVRHTIERVTGPDGESTPGGWLELADGVAVVELAQMSGLPLMARLDPLGASTVGLGEVIADALDAGMRRLIIGAGGSASTDGGAGAFSALGVELIDAAGIPVGPGGGELARLATVGTGKMRAAPTGGVAILADVLSPLLGANGAAAIFGPQKGATATDIAVLDAALARFADLIGGDPNAVGAGAAGGVAYGFATLWDAKIQSGADFVAEATGLDLAIADAQFVITGEGRFDQTSFVGKVVGRILIKAAEAGSHSIVIAGGITADARDRADRSHVATYSLSEIVGSTDAAMSAPSAALIEAGRRAARATLAP